ncbi:cytochrome P450 [Nocardioides sp. Kera G14]|uniref:cytochrome P450 n=1 Tax=Nocardioides sp. Kera G14 TaxID=2884264 RepID=UPI001D0F9406|nr:cytochrome P450 [Nocardioides sp. Kera G14]UDY23534.1 cytochrome P450 [Nocardioides sp. Kera G14]
MFSLKPLARWGLTHGLLRMVITKGAKEGDLQGRLILTASDPTRAGELESIYDEVRAQGGICRGQFSFVTVRHDLVRDVLTSGDFRTGMPTLQKSVLAKMADVVRSEVFSPIEPPSLLVTEPPDHTRYRKLVTRVFTARAVEQLRERTQAVASELLDSLDPSSPVDLVTSYCGLLPVTVISEILGVPLSERMRILEYGEGAAASLDFGLPWSTYKGVDTALEQFDGWLTTHLEWLRAHPGDNLLSQLVRAKDEEGVGLTELELKSLAGLVLAAGFETTVNLLSNGVALLASHPEQLERLRTEPDLWPNAVDEILRLDPPVLLTGRIAAVTTEVGGRRIPAGMAVTTVLAAANHDPGVFEDPLSFDVARHNARDHHAFSAGRHYCLGAQLAKMEGEVGLRTLFDRFPELMLEPGASRRTTRILRGYATLPVALAPADASV